MDSGKSKAGINKLTTSPWYDKWKAMYAIWHHGIRASYDALQQIIMSNLLHRLDRKEIS